MHNHEMGRVLFDLLTTLRAMAIHYQNLHWEAKGLPFYGDHLLFDRLYKNVVERVDVLGEKILGLTGNSLFVSDLHSTQHSHTTLKLWHDYTKGDSPTSRALFSEAYLQEQIEYTYHTLGEQLTLGLDDFLMSLANKHEEHFYLLRQRMSTRLASAAERFFDNPQKREVREFYESGALSNNSEHHEGLEALRAEIAPPTPSEIVTGTAGSDEFSTLSRFIVDTQQEVAEPNDIPQGYSDVSKAEDVRLKQGARQRLTWRKNENR